MELAPDNSNLNASTEYTLKSPLTPDNADNLSIIELLYFSYRDFTADPDRILDEIGFGRAHHRVLYFINRQPGMTVAELLELLRITKQSLARVLKQLIETGHVVQESAQHDRRHRQLFPTEKGRELTLSLTSPQSARITAALANYSPQERMIVEKFLYRMVNFEQRQQITKLNEQITTIIES